MAYEIKPNSQKYKAEQKQNIEYEKRARKVARRGNAGIKKPNVGTKLAGSLISEEASNVKSHIFADVLLPTIKRTIVDIVTDSIHMIFLGETSRRGKRDRVVGDYVSYGRHYNRDDDRHINSRPKERFDYGTIEFDYRDDAEAVIDELNYIIKSYNVARVSDLYDIVELTAPYTAERYGWTSVASADVVRIMGGKWVLKLPKAMPID